MCHPKDILALPDGRAEAHVLVVSRHLSKSKAKLELMALSGPARKRASLLHTHHCSHGMRSPKGSLRKAVVLKGMKGGVRVGDMRVRG